MYEGAQPVLVTRFGALVGPGRALDPIFLLGAQGEVSGMVCGEAELEELVRARGASASADSEDLRVLKELEQKEEKEGGALQTLETSEEGRWRPASSEHNDVLPEYLTLREVVDFQSVALAAEAGRLLASVVVRELPKCNF